jgi:histidinol-phosphate/aromatic aminotransferase/cobyric acid decarboxylase-like protein
VDETYIDYAGSGESVESLTAVHPNLVVCKSMSKAYALSGARVAYLCAAPERRRNCVRGRRRGSSGCRRRSRP